MAQEKRFKLSTLCSSRFVITATIVLLLVIFAPINFAYVIVAQNADNFFHKDLIQDYLAAKAFWDGLSPYVPFGLLARQFGLERFGVPGFAYSTPHAPFQVLLLLWLPLFTYQTSVVIWSVMSVLIVLGVSLAWLKGNNGVQDPVKIGFGLLLIFASSPVSTDIFYGQFSSILLLLSYGLYRSFRTGSHGRAAVYAGLLMSLKFFCSSFILYYLFRRQWKEVILIIGVFVACNLIAVFVFGLHTIISYYLVSVHGVGDFMLLFPGNNSLWVLLYRLAALIAGSSVCPAQIGATATILGITAVLSSVAVLAILTVVWILACKCSDSDFVFVSLLGLSVLVLPIAWEHYLTVLVPIFVASLLGMLSQNSHPPFRALLLMLLATGSCLAGSWLDHKAYTFLIENNWCSSVFLLLSPSLFVVSFAAAGLPVATKKKLSK